MALSVGIHDISPEEYHADPCEEVSLSHSGIVTLLNETPAHFAARNPRLTEWPDLLRRSTAAQDLGSIVHSLILGKGAEFCVMDPSDFLNDDGKTPSKTFGSKAAKAAKEDAESKGLIVINRATNAAAIAVAEAAAKKLRERFGEWPIGESEVAGIWKRQTEHGEIWCRLLSDKWIHRYATCIDFKSTSKSISDEDLRRSIAATGNDIQAAWYLEGLNTIHPELAGLTQFLFVFIEVEPPYEPRVIKLTESWLTRARYRIDRAANLFADCLRKNEWPAWPGDTSLNAPGYLETQWEAAELLEAM